MPLYADDPILRLRQLLGDALALLVSIVAVRVALRVRAAIAELHVVGSQLDASGRGVADGADRAADVLRGLPGIGDAVAGPFVRIGDAGRGLAGAGQQVSDAVATTATVVPLVLAGVVLGYVLFRYLPRRLVWVRETSEVQRLLRSPDAARLLAHRAVSTRSLHLLHRHVDDPAGRFAAGDWQPLAAVELRAAGVADGRLDRPAGVADGGGSGPG